LPVTFFGHAEHWTPPDPKLIKTKLVARGVAKIKFKAARLPKSKLDFAVVSGI
jgi:hypothetical protein